MRNFRSWRDWIWAWNIVVWAKLGNVGRPCISHQERRGTTNGRSNKTRWANARGPNREFIFKIVYKCWDPCQPGYTNLEGTLLGTAGSKISEEGHAIAQAISQRPGFELRWDHIGFVVDKGAPGPVFFEHFAFPFQFAFRQPLHILQSSHTMSSWSWQRRQVALLQAST
jgi:hypothetical protein